MSVLSSCWELLLVVFLSLSSSQKEQIKKVGICCFKNGRESCARSEGRTETWSLGGKAGLGLVRGRALLRLRGAQGTSSGAAGRALEEKHGVCLRNNFGEEIWNIFGGEKT